MTIAPAIRNLASAALLAVALCPWTLQAQNYDFSGKWDLNMDVQLPRQLQSCRFFGLADVAQINGQLSGPVMLVLFSGPPACPAEMEADLSGSPDGTMIFGGMLLGQLGEVTYTGGVTPGKGAPQMTLSGDFKVTVGPYADSAGTWGADVSDGIFRDGFESIVKWFPIPTGTLFLGASLVMLRRRIS